MVVAKRLGINEGYNMQTDTGPSCLDGVTCISSDDSDTWRTEILQWRFHWDFWWGGDWAWRNFHLVFLSLRKGIGRTRTKSYIMIKFQIRGDYCPLLSCAKSSEPNRRTQTDRRTEGLGQEHMAGDAVLLRWMSIVVIRWAWLCCSRLSCCSCRSTGVGLIPVPSKWTRILWRHSHLNTTQERWGDTICCTQHH